MKMEVNRYWFRNPRRLWFYNFTSQRGLRLMNIGPFQFIWRQR